MGVMRRLLVSALLVSGVGSGNRNGSESVSVVRYGSPWSCYLGGFYCKLGCCLPGVRASWTGALVSVDE